MTGEIGDINITDILKLSLSDSYKLFTILKMDNDEKLAEEVTKNYDAIRYGIKLKFDIYYVIRDKQTFKEKSRTIIVDCKEFKLEEYHTEIEEREAKMKNIIIKNIEKIENIIPSF